ncbi:MAG TPA: Sua5/YciO/YrdC/YwlC family protein, partial [Thermodesulfovibrionales bacterium]|nr:Sua5/YciO/YrdC/YwlC family protein [Thermodesulfovibrionales bacterium]
MRKTQMISLALNKDKIDDVISKAVEILRNGGIVAYPTETFYALGVKFDLPRSLKRLYELKKRPRRKAMPVIIDSRATLSEIVSPEWLAH